MLNPCHLPLYAKARLADLKHHIFLLRVIAVFQHGHSPLPCCRQTVRNTFAAIFFQILLRCHKAFAHFIVNTHFRIEDFFLLGSGNTAVKLHQNVQRSLFKIKLDEKKGKLDVDLMNKKGVSRFEAQESVDITLLLPEKFTEHAEVSACVKTLYVEDLRLNRLEYDGDAEKVYIREVMGSVDLTAKTDYEIWVAGSCPRLDVNQFKAKTVVHLKDAENVKVRNNGRKCTVITRKNGEPVDLPENENARNIVSTSGIFSELILELEG